ncbi:MAG TPA: methylated-DNA--[protein]-cysteine S-methyltransferase [Deinococcales bacterium]|nr:methylated-DNA--[protein]-cysteine S-methyltransferase [Deinococcales bacterium]
MALLPVPTTALRFSLVPSPPGHLLVVAGERGIRAVRFGSEEALLAGAASDFPGAERDDAALSATAQAIGAFLSGASRDLDLPLDPQGTPFQRRVWDLVRAIPYGETRSYAWLARQVGGAEAVRAVGAAVGANPLALLVPCHRVVGSDGALRGYRWGLERKRALLELEGGLGLGGAQLLEGGVHGQVAKARERLEALPAETRRYPVE